MCFIKAIEHCFRAYIASSWYLAGWKNLWKLCRALNASRVCLRICNHGKKCSISIAKAAHWSLGFCNICLLFATSFFNVSSSLSTYKNWYHESNKSSKNFTIVYHSSGRRSDHRTRSMVTVGPGYGYSSAIALLFRVCSLTSYFSFLDSFATGHRTLTSKMFKLIMKIVNEQDATII